MNIIVCGSGRVGLSLARKLVKDGHDVTVIENNLAKCKDVEKEIDALIINGNCSEVSILEKANIKKAGVLAAVTGTEETNILACLLAKNINQKCKVYARIEHPEQASVFLKLGINDVIYPEIAAAEHLEELIIRPEVADVAMAHKGGAEMLEIELKSDSSAVGKKIKDVQKPNGYLIAAIYEKDQLKIPSPDTELKRGDRILVLAKKEALQKVKKLF